MTKIRYQEFTSVDFENEKNSLEKTSYTLGILDSTVAALKQHSYSIVFIPGSPQTSLVLHLLEKYGKELHMLMDRLLNEREESTDK